jgi:hypothetical protein
MNLESIQTRIKLFKQIRKFDEKDYLSILDDFDKVYNNKKNSIFNFQDLNYILNEKENFRLYLIENLFRIANEKAKNEDYDNSLEEIKKLNKIIKNSENEYLNKIEKLNSFCLFKKKLLEGKKMIENKEFQNAIKYYKNLIQLTKNIKEKEIYKMNLILAKNEFIQFILSENVNLLQQKKYDEIIKKCEEILNEFQYESKLKNIINETKKLYIGKNYDNLKNENIKEIQNNLIKIKYIINNSDNLKTFDTKIFKLEPDYSWAARIKYSCILAKEKVGKIFNIYSNQKKSIEELNTVKNIIDTFIGDLSSQSTLNKLTFSFFKKNMELIKDENFKTEIELQNENRKNFLEIIKKLIDENIETIQKFIDEDNKENTLELDKILIIEEIIKKYNTIDINYKKDIKIYMGEFGFTSFEVLTIKKTKKYIGNILIITLGILEFCAGTALLYYSSNPKNFQLARFLIREGIKDVITGVKATINGEEISLKSYALEYFTGNVSNIDQNFRNKLLSVVKGECFKH